MIEYIPIDEHFLSENKNVHLRLINKDSFDISYESIDGKYKVSIDNDRYNVNRNETFGSLVNKCDINDITYFVVNK